MLSGSLGLGGPKGGVNQLSSAPPLPPPSFFGAFDDDDDFDDDFFFDPFMDMRDMMEQSRREHEAVMSRPIFGAPPMMDLIPIGFGGPSRRAPPPPPIPNDHALVFEPEPHTHESNKADQDSAHTSHKPHDHSKHSEESE